MNAKQTIRSPRFADGSWYSANPTQLANDVDTYLADPPPDLSAGQLVGLVAPHAGHFFSGHVAGAGFAALSPKSFSTVILIGPDHRGAAPSHVSTPEVSAWRTPLGDIPVNRDMLNVIRHQFKVVPLSTDNEHSLEIELPFLQTTLTTFSLVPLMMGDQSLTTCKKLSAALVNAIQQTGSSTLLVASSDLSHFFDDATARQLDEDTLQFVLNLNAPGLIRHIETGRMQGQPLACGSGPIATVMLVAQALGATQAKLIKYATSADVHPDKSRVVGYAAVAFHK